MRSLCTQFKGIETPLRPSLSHNEPELSGGKGPRPSALPVTQSFRAVTKTKELRSHSTHGTHGSTRAPLGSDQTRSQNTVCITRGGELWALNNPQILSWPLGHFQERAQRQSRELC